MRRRSLTLPVLPPHPQLIIRWYLRTFVYIDRYYITRHNLQTLKDIGMACFHQQVYNYVTQAEVKGANPVAEIKVKDMIKDAVLILIDKARVLRASALPFSRPSRLAAAPRRIPSLPLAPPPTPPAGLSQRPRQSPRFLPPPHLSLPCPSGPRGRNHQQAAHQERAGLLRRHGPRCVPSASPQRAQRPLPRSRPAAPPSGASLLTPADASASRPPQAAGTAWRRTRTTSSGPC